MDLFGDLPAPKSSADNESQQQGNSSISSQSPTESSETQATTTISEKRKIDSSNDETANKRPCTECKFTLSGFIGEMRGEREEMQDAYCIKDDLLSSFDDKPVSVNRLGYYAIFDGHAGKRASQYAAESLYKHIILNYPKGNVINKDREIKMCIFDAFKRTDEAFLQSASASVPTWKDGSTAVTILLVDDVMYIANLGDSKAVLCRYKDDGTTSLLRLTKDQTPTDYEERMRIQKAGGFVKEGRVMGILEVARSIGDGRFKHCGVIAVPEIKRCTLTKNDKFVIIACDGLWKAFGVDEAVAYVDSLLKDEQFRNLQDAEDPKMQLSEEQLKARHYANVCYQLAKEAVRKQSGDNVTVMLIIIEER